MIALTIISKQRSALMGLAILWVYFFHSSIKIPIVSHLASFGWGGVDVFLFLSAIGLCYSMSKNSDVCGYYHRRVLRIFPTWWVLITFFFLWSVFHDGIHPSTLLEGILYYSGVGWWINGLWQTFRSVSYEWYVPTLLLLYLIFPFLNKLSYKHLSILLVLSIILTGWMTCSHHLDCIYWSHQRFPVFIFGVLYYRFMNKGDCNRERLYNLAEIMGLLIGITLLLYARMYVIHDRTIGLFLQRMGIMIALPLMLKILALTIDYVRLSKVMSFVGAISLEIYLIHIYCETEYSHPLYFFIDEIPNKNFAILITLLVVVFISFMVNRSMKYIVEKICTKR